MGIVNQGLETLAAMAVETVLQAPLKKVLKHAKHTQTHTSMAAHTHAHTAIQHTIL